MRLLPGAVLCALFPALLAPPVAAQEIPRLKARIDNFDGKTLEITTDDGKHLAVGILPATVYLYDVKRSVADIHPGDFVGASALAGEDGKLHAQEVHIFPETMRGNGEGHYPMGQDSQRSMTNAAVLEVAGHAGPGQRNGRLVKNAPGGGVTLTLHYRGAEQAADGACTGRAPPDKIVCIGETEVEVAPDTPVVALVPGDQSLLVPGAEILIFVAAAPDGKKVTPGLSVEKDGFKPLI